jgi:hypothetical protein
MKKSPTAMKMSIGTSLPTVEDVAGNRGLSHAEDVERGKNHHDHNNYHHARQTGICGHPRKT